MCDSVQQKLGHTKHYILCDFKTKTLYNPIPTIDQALWKSEGKVAISVHRTCNIVSYLSRYNRFKTKKNE